MPILIYGATGYSGRLAAAEAKRRAIDAILAGRNAEAVRALAGSLGFEARPFEISDAPATAEALKGVGAVLNLAGPFANTAAPLADACIATGAHYIDICGELPVLEAILSRDGAARARGVVLLPAAGFDVAASDCLFAYVAAKAEGPTELSLVVDWRGGVSRATVITMTKGLRDGIFASRHGARVAMEPPPRRTFTLEGKATHCVACNYGDVVVAPISTGVGDVTVYFPVRSAGGLPSAMPAVMRRVITSETGLAALNRLLALMPSGPDLTRGDKARATLYATSAGGTRNAAAKLAFARPNLLTTRVAVDIAHRISNGEAKAGFQTPSRAFGAGYITGFDGVKLTDLTSI